MIELHTLGDAVIRVGDREIRPTSPTVFAALLYLGVERGQRVPRIALQEMLFPETDERSGAHSLRQLLYKLRQLGAAVQAEGDVVWLAAEDVVDDYSAPAPTNGSGNGTGNGHRGAQFLAGYAPSVSNAYDEWLESRRTTVSTALRRGLIRHMLARRDAADWISVERLAQEVLTSDPFNEEATFALAESTALAGSKSEAVRILERYESETGRADLKLPAAILRRRISERLPDRRRRALDTPFVGRDAEAEAMRQTVVQLRAGHGGTVVIAGEPGIGKTRLFEETSALAMLEGVNVHVVRCQPHYTTRPMGVFIEWVPMLMASRGALGVAPETLEHLTLLTSHRDDRANRPSDARDDATRSGTLMAAIRDLVDAVASETPILLAVEDAHWADPTSLRELCTLLEKRRCASLLIVYSTRMLEPLREIGVLTDSTPLLKLKPLLDGSMLELSRHLLLPTEPASPAPELREWCARTAGGNPLYLQMLCAHYEDTREPFSVPPTMRTATAQRIDMLPRGHRRLLEIAVLLGHHAKLDAIKGLSALSDLEFVDGIQRLEEEGFLRTSGVAARIAHDLLSDCLLDTIPPLTLKVLHSMVAAGLEASYDATSDATVLWDCAEHWVASGESTKALRFVVRCAEHAADIGQASRALDLLQRSRVFAVAQSELLGLLEATSRTAKAARQWNAVLEAETDLSALRRSGTEREHDESELRAIEARWLLSLVSTEAASLLSCARSGGASRVHRVDAAYLAVRMAFENGDFALAHQAYAAVATLLGTESSSTNAELLQLIYHTSFGDQELAKSLAQKIRDTLRSRDVGAQIRIARNLGVAFCFLGDPNESFALHSYYYGIACQLDLKQYQFDLAAACSQVLANAGDFGDAEVWYARANDHQRSGIGSSVELTHTLTGLEIALHGERREDAQSLLAELGKFSAGESFRVAAHTTAGIVRVAQLDAGYQCSDATIDELKRLLELTMPLLCADGVIVALGEALKRRDRPDELRATLRSYTMHRRDRSPLPDEVQRLASNCGFDLASR